MRYCRYILFCITLPGFAHQPLTIDAVLKSVKKYHPEILQNKLQLDLSYNNLLSAQGEFDPDVSAEYKTTPQGGYETNYLDSQINIPLITHGIELFSGYRRGRGDFPIYYQNYLTNEQGEARAGLKIPLLRNSNTDKQRTALLNAALQINDQKQKYTFKQSYLFQQAANTYWQWVRAGHTLNIYQQLLSLSLKRQSAIKSSVTTGAYAQLTSVENQRLIYQGKQNVNLAQQRFLQRSNDLALYYRDFAGHPLQATLSELPPIKSFPLKLKPLSDNQLLKIVNQHPMLQSIAIKKQQIMQTIKLSENQLQPMLNALAYTEKDFGKGEPKKNKQSYNLALTLQWNIFNRKATAELNKQKIHLRHTQIDYLFTQDKLLALIKNILIELKSYKTQVIAIKNNLKLAQKIEHAEAERFSQGDSSLFLVNQREQDTAFAKMSLISVLTEYHLTLYKLQMFCMFESSCIKKFIQSP